ncbi:MAG: hypothetical protein CM15mP58_00540 [Burkholderiaceae bacterium]|nr:MAG: hypothetical protein CM15mP58_00540 [Burkholderiaceae bacterium]
MMQRVIFLNRGGASVIAKISVSFKGKNGMLEYRDFPGP